PAALPAPLLRRLWLVQLAPRSVAQAGPLRVQPQGPLPPPVVPHLLRAPALALAAARRTTQPRHPLPVPPALLPPAAPTSPPTALAHRPQRGLLSGPPR